MIKKFILTLEVEVETDVEDFEYFIGDMVSDKIKEDSSIKKVEITDVQED